MNMQKRSLDIDIELANGEKKTSDLSQTQTATSPQVDPPRTVANPEGLKVLCNKITLNDGISKGNFYASLIHTLVTFSDLTATTTLQPLILLDPKFYAVDINRIGVILAQLILLQTVTKICFTPAFGYLIDKLGRKPMMLVGGALVLMGYGLVPFQRTVFPGYAISKLLVANGTNILILLPFNADYVHDASKGKVTGFSQALTSFGSFFGSVMITILLSMGLDLAQIHVVVGIFTFGMVVIYSNWIKGGNYYLKKGQNDDEEFLDKVNQEESFKDKMKKSINALSKNGWLLISLIINTLARADYYLITIVFALWIKGYDKTDAERKESDKLINHYEDLFFFLGLVGNLGYGFILDMVNPMKVIFPTILGGLLGYSLILFANSKDSIFVLLLIVTAGLAMPGLFNSANYLAIRNFPKELRGSISSLINVFGIAGYLFLSTIGGYLYDNVSKKMPYVLFLMMLILAAIGVSLIYAKLRRYGRKRRPQANNTENAT